MSTLSLLRVRRSGTRTCTRPVADLSLEERDSIYRLYAPHHTVDRDTVERRLRNNLDRVHLFSHGDTLVGFLGMRVERVTLGRRTTVAVYMGLGFIEPPYRGKWLIQRAVVKQLLACRAAHPLDPIVFWTDAVSYKPYLLISRNLKHFHPCRHRVDPHLQALADVLGQRHYGAAYAQGVVTKTTRLVRDGVADIDPELLQSDPDVAFYAARNPNHRHGDGLLVVLPASASNVSGWLVRRVRGRHATRR